MVAVRMRTAGQQALRRNNHHDGPGIIMPGAAACAFDTGALQPAVPLHEGDVLRRSPSLPCFFIPVFQTLAPPVVPGVQALSAWLCAISIQFLSAACAARMRGVSAHALRCVAGVVADARTPSLRDFSGMDIADDNAVIGVMRSLWQRIAACTGNAMLPARERPARV